MDTMNLFIHFLHDYLREHKSNLNLNMEFDFTDSVPIRVGGNGSTFKFSNLVGMESASGLIKPTDHVRSVMQGELYFAVEKDVSGTFSKANYQFVEEKAPFYFVLTNLALFRFDYDKYDEPVEVYYICKTSFMNINSGKY
jgi:hypothetical protein